MTCGDTFGVSIGVGDSNLEFLVRVPSDIDSGWTDPEAFQRLLERVVWRELDQEAVLQSIASSVPSGRKVSLGTVTLTPDGTVVAHDLEAPRFDDTPPQQDDDAPAESTTDADGE